MDTDLPHISNSCSGNEPLPPRLRFDASHPQPPRPIFVRLDDRPPEIEEG